MEELELPKGFQPLATQVAGHTFQTNSLGLLQNAGTGTVLKPLGKPDCGERELGFYESFKQREEQKLNGVLQQLRPLVPTYHRKLKLMVNGREHTFLQLEDVSHGLRKPCIMDIKIGRRTWDPLASEEKREVEEQKYVRCKQVLGLCLPGYQMYPLMAAAEDVGKRKSGKVIVGAVQRYGKEYGKQLDAEGFRKTIALFLNAQPPLMPCEPLVRELLRQLYAIRQWFKVQTLLRFYASSLLIAYDVEAVAEYYAASASHSLANGCAQIEQDAGDKPAAPPLDPSLWVKVKMIDFAHVFPAGDAATEESGSLDTNYLFGLQHLIAIVEELLLVR